VGVGADETTRTVPVILPPQCGVHMYGKVPAVVKVCSTRCPSVVDPKSGVGMAVHPSIAVVCTTSWVSPGMKQTRCPTKMVTVFGVNANPSVVTVTSHEDGPNDEGSAVGVAVGDSERVGFADGAAVGDCERVGFVDGTAVGEFVIEESFGTATGASV
jgi:hypothetical protein